MTFARFQALWLSLLLMFAVGPAGAQSNDEELRATGLLLVEPDVLNSFPKSPTYRLFLPESVDLSGRMPAVGNQGSQGSCVGWAVGYAARSYYQSASNNMSLASDANIASPGFIYDAIRPSDCDDGSYTSDALDLLKSGALSYVEYPYDDAVCRRPTQQELAGASEFNIRDWQSIDVDVPDQIKGALAMGHPVIISARVDRAFHGLRDGDIWQSTSAPVAGEGGHAITLVGYDDRDRTYTFINSWGTYWGTEGYGRMSYDAFDARVRAAYRIIPNVDPVRPYIDPVPVPTPDPVTPAVDLPAFECARLEAGTDRTSGAEEIRGFVSLPEDIETLENDFGDQYQINVRLRPWPQCEALLIVSGSEDSINGIMAPAVTLSDTRYVQGDPLVIEVQMPPFSGYLHLAYFQADGSVVNLRQTAAGSLQTLLPNEVILLGDGQEGRSKFTVSGPFGTEMVLAIATRSPLFDAPRPLVETEREFLSALRASTIDFEQTDGRFYAASELPIQTVAGGTNPTWMPPEYGPQSPRQ